LEVIITLGLGEMWHLPVDIPRDATLNDFLIRFSPLYMAEARLRHHDVSSLEPKGYHRHDSLDFYLLPVEHDALDEKIVEVLVGDHPSRLSRGLRRALWGDAGQDVPLSNFVTGDVQLLVAPRNGRVATPHTAQDNNLFHT